MKNRIKETIIISSFIFISIILYCILSNEIKFGDIFLNLSTELIGILITIIILDNIMKHREEKKHLPIKISMFNNVQSFLIEICNFWSVLYFYSQEFSNEIDFRKLFERDTFEKIVENLDLESSRRNWFETIHNESKKIYNKGRLMDNYITFLDPEIISKILYLIEDKFFINSLISISNSREYDIRNKIPKPTYLGAYYHIPDEEVFKSIHFIYNWCQKTYFYLSTQKINVKKLDSIFPRLNKETSIITHEKKTDQINKYKYWEKEQLKNSMEEKT